MKHADALIVADKFIELLSPTCTRIEIAGSIRRGKADVKDIEIVAIPDLTVPKSDRPEFGKPIPRNYRTGLDKLLGAFQEDGWLELDKSGGKYKKITVNLRKFSAAFGIIQLSGEINVDLFLVTPPAEWGVQMVIRTGPAEFSHWIVTRRCKGGALPDDYIVEDGCVGYRFQSDKGDARRGSIPMPEELDFLNFLGLGWIEPSKREAKWNNALR